jgi:hypothetical protein
LSRALWRLFNPLKEEDFYECSEKPFGLPGAAHEYPTALCAGQIAGFYAADCEVSSFSLFFSVFIDFMDPVN